MLEIRRIEIGMATRATVGQPGRLLLLSMALAIVLASPAAAQPSATGPPSTPSNATGATDPPAMPTGHPAQEQGKTPLPTDKRAGPKNQADEAQTPRGQATASSSDISIFPWVWEKDSGRFGNWPKGLAHFFLGLIGALITVYLFLGEFLPSTGGKVNYEQLKHELEDMKKQRDSKMAERQTLGQKVSGLTQLDQSQGLALQAQVAESNTALETYNRQIEFLAKQVAQERWHLFMMGFPIYLVLGGFFASAFAVNYIQAVVVGFGWTAVADRIGLKKEVAEKSRLTKENIDQITGAATAAIDAMKKELQKRPGS